MFIIIFMVTASNTFSRYLLFINVYYQNVAYRPLLTSSEGPWARDLGPMGPGPWAHGTGPMGPWDRDLGPMGPGPWDLGTGTLGPWDRDLVCKLSFSLVREAMLRFGHLGIYIGIYVGIYILFPLIPKIIPLIL